MNDGESSSSNIFVCHGIVKELYPLLEVSIDTIESEMAPGTRSEQVLSISRKVKGYHEVTGPFETVRIVIDGKLHYTVYIFCEKFAEGNLSTAHDVEQLDFFKKMEDPSWIVCHGVSGYSSYKSYTVKNAVTMTIPQDCVRHKSCDRIFQLAGQQKSLVCRSCLSLKHYLTTRKRKYDALSSDDRLRRQSSSSTVPT